MPDVSRGPADAYRELAGLADYCTPLALRCAADLGVADVLAEGPLSVDAIATKVSADPDALRRVLRALAARDVFTEDDTGHFANTQLSTLLRSDHPLSMRDGLTFVAPHIAAWSRFDHTIRTGEPAFDEVHGATEWEYLAGHADAGERFDRSMRTLTRLMLRLGLRSYPWRDLGTVVDLGGGDGTFACGLLSRYKDLRAILVDRPEVVAHAPGLARDARVADRLDVVGGNLFGNLPAGHDTYLLKLVLHGFADDDAVAILRNVRSAMRPDSRLLVVESVLDRDGAGGSARVMDLQMLATTVGRERTEAEFAALFDAAGLRLARVVDSPVLPVVEGAPAGS